MKKPTLFADKIHQCPDAVQVVSSVETVLEKIISENNLVFFEEYTNHGMPHVEAIFGYAEKLIPHDYTQNISSDEAAVLSLAILLHDIGMHTTWNMFRGLIAGRYDAFRVAQLDKNTWAELWQNYLDDIRHISTRQCQLAFGCDFVDLSVIDLEQNETPGGTGRKVIGEFLRRHHHRLAHEIALGGIRTHNNQDILFAADPNSPKSWLLPMAGLVARSHGMELRKVCDYLKKTASGRVWMRPHKVKTVYLMVLLRLADYLHMDSSRTSPVVVAIRQFNSSFSAGEHAAHLASSDIILDNADKELIYVDCQPANSQVFVRLQQILKGIQYELDMAWAILGEAYDGLESHDFPRPRIRFRRISSNLEEEHLLESLPYVPAQSRFEVNNELARLLIAPLYGDNPSFGIRELTQNATDACKEKKEQLKQKGDTSYKGQVTIDAWDKDPENKSFRIADNGKGMTLKEIRDYFLTIGSSLRSSTEWNKQFKGKVNRNGRFGIGVLAAFLLGDEIEVSTKSDADPYRYTFKARFDSDFIEIGRERFDGPSGTIIEVKMREGFEAFEKNSIERSFPHWSRWYVDPEPAISVNYNGEPYIGYQKSYLFERQEKKNYIFEKPERKHHIFYPGGGYGKLKWYPNAFFQTGFWDSGYSAAIICNGIIITKKSTKKILNKSVNNNYLNTVNSLPIPSFHIEDPLNLLPLKLDRSDIDCSNLPFEAALHEEVIKDYLAQFLTINLLENNDIIFGSFNSFRSLDTPLARDLPSLLFTQQGYSISIAYFSSFIDKPSYNCYFVNMPTRKSSELLVNIHDGQLPDNLLIIPYLLTDKTLSVLFKSQFARQYAVTGYFKKNPAESECDDLFRIGQSAPKRKVKNDYTLYYGVGADNWKFSQREQQLFRKDVKKLAGMASPTSHLYIFQVIGKELLSCNIDSLFTEYLDKYFGPTRTFIPYNLADRQRMFPEAFADLKQYMLIYLSEAEKAELGW